jgi:maltose phosphorylase
MEYAEEVASYVKSTNPAKYSDLVKSIHFNEEKEIAKWREIRSNMYFPVDEKLGIFLQQEGYMDKEQILVKDLDPKERPINQKWSWDRILRSCFIKQADVLQGLYFLETDLIPLPLNVTTIFTKHEPFMNHPSLLAFTAY